MLLDSKSSPCEIIQAHMTALLDDELSQSDAFALRSHIAGCAICTQSFEQIQQTLKATDAWNAAGQDVWEEVEKRIKAEPKSSVAGAESQPQLEPLQRNRELTAEQLAETLYVHTHRGGDIGRILVDLGHAGERDVLEAKAQAEGLPFIDLTMHRPESSAFSMLPRSFALKHNALPVKKDQKKLWVAMLDPRDVVTLDAIRLVTRCQVHPLLAAPADLEQAIVEAYFSDALKPTAPVAEVKNTDAVSQEDLRAVLTEMRALRTEIQELRGEVGSLRRLLTATRQTAPAKIYRPHSSPQMMPLPLPENSGIGLL